MRKLAPVFIAASVFAISSSAFALGDKRDKAAPNTATTSSATMATPSTPSTSASGTVTSGGGTSALPQSGTPASDATTSGASMGASGSVSGTTASGAAVDSTAMSGTPAPDKSSGVKKNKQVAGNDPARCDITRYATRTEMPKDCLDGKSGGAAVGSTQGQSGR